MKTFRKVCLEADYMRLYVELCYFNRSFYGQGSFGLDRKRKSMMSSTPIGIAQGGFLNEVLKSVSREAKARMIGKVSKINAGLLGANK